ncbi:STAS domain-containing protein [Actinoplanes sp. NPDC023714]|uniref:STAS domain-containing protein n=1 Tax=Actinoplanes sp. NPDC023714 TaxID=3154322 RepID=UPI0034012B55
MDGRSRADRDPGMTSLGISVSGGSAGTVVLRVAGDIDIDTAPRLRDAIEAQLARRPAQLCVELSGVAFIDSMGAQTLLDCRASAMDSHCRLRLAGPQVLVHNVLDMRGVVEVFGLPAAPDVPWRGSEPRQYAPPRAWTPVEQTVEQAERVIAEAREIRRRAVAVSAAARRLLDLRRE